MSDIAGAILSPCLVCCSPHLRPRWNAADEKRRGQMQHPLRTNKAFQMAYTSSQERQHRRYLTADNVGELVVSLDRLQQQQRKERHETVSGEPFLQSPPPLPVTFTEVFMKHRGLPLQPPPQHPQPLPLLAHQPATQQQCTSPSKKLYLKGGDGGGGGRATLAPLDTVHHSAEQQDGHFSRRVISSTNSKTRPLCSRHQLPRNGSSVDHVQALRSVLRRSKTTSVLADRCSPSKPALRIEPQHGDRW